MGLAGADLRADHAKKLCPKLRVFDLPIGVKDGTIVTNLSWKNIVGKCGTISEDLFKQTESVVIRIWEKIAVIETGMEFANIILGLGRIWVGLGWIFIQWNHHRVSVNIEDRRFLSWYGFHKRALWDIFV